MVDLITTLTPSRCKTGVIAHSKTQALEFVSDLMAQDLPFSSSLILAQFQKREQKASTALGMGVAIPHARLSCQMPLSALVRLETAQDFAAQDGQKVDLIFALIVPEQATTSHLNLLQQIAKIVGHKNFYTLRQAQNAQDLWQIVAQISS